MPKFELLNPVSIHGSRFERGTIVELTDDEAKAFDPADIAPATEVEPTVEETEPVNADEETTDEKPKARRTRKAE